MLRRRTSKNASARGRRAPALDFSGPGPAEGAATDEADLRIPDLQGAEAAPLDPLLAHATVGEALKAVREAQGLTLEALAAATRVRRAYLVAIEEMRLDALPSRPFTLGYIRAYAGALGLDPDLAAERFKVEEPVLDEPLPEPVGVPDESDPRVAAFLIGALVIIVAIVLWNVAQRAMMAGAPPPPMARQDVARKALAGLKTGPIELGPPLPAPVESTTPPPYETPGLAAAMGLKSEAGVGERPKPADEGPQVDVAALPRVFVPTGKVYDAGGGQQPLTAVTIQALKPASLILRGADGSVYFARQLSKGEAVRMPQIAGLTIDVSNARDLQVFVAGQSRGLLPANQVLASKLGAPPASP